MRWAGGVLTVELVVGQRALPLARFVCNPHSPRIHDANHASRLRAETPQEIQAVFARAEQVFSGLGHRRFLCDPFTPPPFEAQLVQQGYRVDAELQLLLDGELRASPPEIDLRLAETPADWGAIARLTRLDHEEEAEKFERPLYPQEVTDQMVATKRVKCPPLRFWIARVDGADCAFFSSWPGDNGVLLIRAGSSTGPWIAAGIPEDDD